MNSTVKIIAGVIVLLGAIIALVLLTGNKEEDLNGGTPVSQRDADEVVARVNGEEITQAELSTQITQLSQNPQVQIPSQSDADAYLTFEKNILDQIVSRKILIAQAQQEGFTPTNEEVDAEFATLSAQFESEEAFNTQLSSAGITAESLRTDITNQLTISKYAEKLSTDNQITVTDEEIQTVYDQQVAVQENAPSLEEVKEEIRTYVQSQKQEELILAKLDELKASANIEILI